MTSIPPINFSPVPLLSSYFILASGKRGGSSPANGLQSVLGLPLPLASQCLGPFHQLKGRKKKKLEDQVESLELHYNHKLENDAGLGEKESKGEVMSVPMWVGPQ